MEECRLSERVVNITARDVTKKRLFIVVESTYTVANIRLPQHLGLKVYF